MEGAVGRHHHVLAHWMGECEERKCKGCNKARDVVSVVSEGVWTFRVTAGDCCNAQNVHTGIEHLED